MLLKELASACGVTGCEDEVRAIVERTVTPYVDEIKHDALGSIIAIKKGKKDYPKVMLSAHMDEVGYIITAINDDGTLVCESLGRLDLKISGSKTVFIGKNHIHGVIRAMTDYYDSYIDIGATSYAQAVQYVSVGDPVAFSTRFEDFGDGFKKSKALDDRTGCGVLAEVLKGDYDCPVYGVFSAQEEIGERGAWSSSYLVQPDVGIVLEGTVCSDVSVVEPYRHSTTLGGGPAVSIADRTTHFDVKLSGAICELAKKRGIPCQRRRITGGGNDGGAIHVMGSGARCITVSVPCRYIHSPICVTSTNDFNNTVKLVSTFLTEIGNGGIKI